MEHKFLSLILLVLAPIIPTVLIISPVFPRNAVIIRRFAKWFAGLHLIYAYCFLLFFNPNLLLSSYKTDIVLFNSDWIKTMGISSVFAMDGLSVLLCLLTTFIFFIALIVSKYAISSKHKFYYASVLFLETCVLGALCAKDMFFMFMFWVLAVIPLYFLMSVFGKSQKEADKYLIINSIGNMFLLFGILTLYYYSFSSSGILTADIEAISFDELTIPIWLQILTFICFLIGFSTRFIFFPIHAFFTKLQENLPMPINIILSSIIFCMGTYGFIEYNMHIFPTTFKTLALILMILSVTGIIHCSMVAFAQNNIKRIFYYLSAVFINFILLGFTTMSQTGLTGSIFMIFAHGLIFTALFLISGIIYLRTKTLDIEELGGIVRQMPKLTYFTIPVCITITGLPFLVIFPAILMIILGTFSTELLDEISFQLGGIITIFSLIFISAAILRFLHKVFFGNILTKFATIKDVSMSEFISLTGIIIPILVLGLIPSLLINVFDSVILITMDILRI